MALQDVCGYLQTSADIYSHPSFSNQVGDMWRTPLEVDRFSPFHFLCPPPNNGHPTLLSSNLSHLSSPNQPFQLSHGTTTLGFIFQGGVIAAADTRASCKGLICCPKTQKIMPIHSHLVVNSSGSGADCSMWERILSREMRLYQLRHRRFLSIKGAAKLLSMMLHPFKGTELCVAATLCGWDGEECQLQWKGDLLTHFEHATDVSIISAKSPIELHTMTSINEQEELFKESSAMVCENVNKNLSTCGGESGPMVCYVCSDGLQLNGQIISVGSGSPYAYGVLDDGWRWEMTVDEAVALAREAVYRATHWDAYSGNNVDLFFITARGWRRRKREDLKEEFYREREKEKENIKNRKKERQKCERESLEDDETSPVQC